MKIIYLLTFSLVISQEPNFNLDTLISNLNQPWGIEFLDSKNILITEKNGQLIRYDFKKTNYISGLPKIDNTSQGGILDIKKHPNYSNNNIIYFTATSEKDGKIGTSLYKAILAKDSLESVEMIFHAKIESPRTGIHVGSRIVIDKSGFIFVSTGDGGNPAAAQDLSNHNGTIVRLTLNGETPKDNPFIGQSMIMPEIWSYGHRNVQGMAIHPMTGEIWSHEHGPKGGDEINIIKKGANYGWPLATFGVNYDGTIISNDTSIVGAEDPIYHWTPSIAPCGMNFYFSNAIPDWSGSLFLGALADRHLNRIEISNDNKVIFEERLFKTMARFRQVIQGEDGWLYFITESPGLLCRITYETLDVKNEFKPKSLSLKNNYPNPFNSKTKINFNISTNEDVKIIIFNLSGQSVKSYNFRNINKGSYSVTWNGLNNLNEELSGGVYFYQLKTDEYSITKKMLFLK